MTNLNEIVYVDWQLQLNKIGGISQGVDDINQCIAIILITKKGTVPHRPTFGSEIYKYIDYPVNEAIPNIVREATDAITEWEKRILVKSVKAQILNEVIKINVEWTLKENNTQGKTTITL